MPMLMKDESGVCDTKASPALPYEMVKQFLMRGAAKLDVDMAEFI